MRLLVHDRPPRGHATPPRGNRRRGRAVLGGASPQVPKPKSRLSSGEAPALASAPNRRRAPLSRRRLPRRRELQHKTNGHRGRSPSGKTSRGDKTSRGGHRRAIRLSATTRSPRSCCAEGNVLRRIPFFAECSKSDRAMRRKWLELLSALPLF